MDSLPTILISARTMADAAYIMSEITEEEAVAGGAARVWRVRNKYYGADVRLAADADEAGAGDAADALGHVVYLGADELTAGAAERRAARAPAAEVRVVCARAASLPAALLAWAARARYEPVPLLAAADARAGEPGGAAALRAALHAHAWPGLARRPPAEAPGGGAEEERWARGLEALAAGAAGVRALPAHGAERRAAAEALLLAALGADADDL